MTIIISFINIINIVIIIIIGIACDWIVIKATTTVVVTTNFTNTAYGRLSVKLLCHLGMAYRQIYITKIII